MKKGLFIVIDGTDGSGKTTQAELLMSRLRQGGHRVETISFPQYDRPSGMVTKKYLSGEYGTAEEVGPHAASVLFAVDRYDAKKSMLATLNVGTILIANRYVTSNMGHQGGKISDRAKRIEFYRWEDDFEYGLLGLPRPDLSLILHAPAEIGMALAAERDGSATADIHQADIGHLKAAEQAYLDLVATFPDRFQLIECAADGKMLERPKVHEMIWRAVQEKLA